MDLFVIAYVTGEPGAPLEDIGANGRAEGASVFSAVGQQSEFWCREGAAHGLLRLCGGSGSEGTMCTIAPSTPGHHGDDRYIPALCRAAVRRLQAKHAAGHGGAVAAALLPILAAPEVARQWDAMVLAAESVECPEPWLAGRQTCTLK